MELNAVTVSPSPIPSTPANAASGRSRDLYIDRLRSLMTALVILHHTALTYGAMGSWFWYELKPSTALSSQILIQFCTSNQAYFMAFFFFLAAYFTPASLERKGHGQFIADRFTRLGLPLLAFILILAPFTEALAHWGAAPLRRLAPCVGGWHRPRWIASRSLLDYAQSFAEWRL